MNMLILTIIKIYYINLLYLLNIFIIYRIFFIYIIIINNNLNMITAIKASEKQASIDPTNNIVFLPNFFSKKPLKIAVIISIPVNKQLNQKEVTISVVSLKIWLEKKITAEIPENY